MLAREKERTRRGFAAALSLFADCSLSLGMRAAGMEGKKEGRPQRQIRGWVRGSSRGYRVAKQYVCVKYQIRG